MDLHEARSTFDAHVRRGIFQPVARHIKHDPEDRLQDAVCQTWAMFRRYAERGKELEPAILVHSCRLRAGDISRHFAGDGTHKKHDVYDSRNYLEGRVALVDIDAAHRDGGVVLGFAEPMSTNPTRKVNSAIDLSDWLAALPAGDRKMLELRAEGHSWKVAGAAVGLPLRAAFDRGKRLGRELSERMGVRVDGEARSRRRAGPAAQLLHAA